MLSSTAGRPDWTAKWERDGDGRGRRRVRAASGRRTPKACRGRACSRLRACRRGPRGVLDDRETESGAALFACTPLVDPIERADDPRQLHRRAGAGRKSGSRPRTGSNSPPNGLPALVHLRSLRGPLVPLGGPGAMLRPKRRTTGRATGPSRTRRRCRPTRSRRPTGPPRPGMRDDRAVRFAVRWSSRRPRRSGPTDPSPRVANAVVEPGRLAVVEDRRIRVARHAGQPKAHSDVPDMTVRKFPPGGAGEVLTKWPYDQGKLAAAGARPLAGSCSIPRLCPCSCAQVRKPTAQARRGPARPRRRRTPVAAATDPLPCSTRRAPMVAPSASRSRRDPGRSSTKRDPRPCSPLSSWSASGRGE